MQLVVPAKEFDGYHSPWNLGVIRSSDLIREQQNRAWRRGIITRIKVGLEHSNYLCLDHEFETTLGMIGRERRSSSHTISMNVAIAAIFCALSVAP